MERGLKGLLRGGDCNTTLLLVDIVGRRCKEKGCFLRWRKKLIEKLWGLNIKS